jgi:hypothetical protein
LNAIQQRVWIAALAGSLISVALYFVSYSFPSSFLLWLQSVGVYATIVIRGLHTATKTDFAMIAIPINAAVYAVAILGFMRIFASKRTSSRPQ